MLDATGATYPISDSAKMSRLSRLFGLHQKHFWDLFGDQRGIKKHLLDPDIGFLRPVAPCETLASLETVRSSGVIKSISPRATEVRMVQRFNAIIFSHSIESDYFSSPKVIKTLEKHRTPWVKCISGGSTSTVLIHGFKSIFQSPEFR